MNSNQVKNVDNLNPTENPDSFNKSYDGNVIIKVMEGAEMYSKLAVIEPSEYGLKPVVVYTVSDKVLAYRERIIDALAVGEKMDKYPNISRLLDVLINQEISADILLEKVKKVENLPMEQKDQEISKILKSLNLL